MSVFDEVGAAAFGAVVGWLTYRIVRRSSESSGISDLVTVIAALGGGVVVDTRFAKAELFAAYGLGLAVGFFGYFVAGLLIERSERGLSADRTLDDSTPPESDAAPTDETAIRANAPSVRVSGWMGDQGNKVASVDD